MPSRSFRIGRSATGLGLFATKAIKRAAYIATYRGRRISAKEAARRERRGAKYMFELTPQWVIDGSPRWNVAHHPRPCQRRRRPATGEVDWCRNVIPDLAPV